MHPVVDVVFFDYRDAKICCLAEVFLQSSTYVIEDSAAYILVDSMHPVLLKTTSNCLTLKDG